MSLTTVTNGNTANANDLNQVINVLQQPGAGQEKGKYWLAGAAYTTGANVSFFVISESRNATPVSVSFDTTDFSPSNLGAITTDHLTSNGFHIWANSSATAAVCQAGGNWTIQF